MYTFNIHITYALYMPLANVWKYGANQKYIIFFANVEKCRK